MREAKVNALSLELKKSGSVSFEHDGLSYCITESCQEDGYSVDVFNSGDDIDVDEPIDGGLCTGSEKDAIEFMI